MVTLDSTETVDNHEAVEDGFLGGRTQLKNGFNTITGQEARAKTRLGGNKGCLLINFKCHIFLV